MVRRGEWFLFSSEHRSMWCSHCQQDVPGIAIPEDGHRLGCARCRGLLRNQSKPEHSPKAASEAAPLPPLPKSPPSLDDWTLDDDLAAVTRMMRTLRIDAPSARMPSEPTQPTIPLMMAAQPRHTTSVAPTPRRGSLFAWPALMLGMMAFACGGVLLGWSFVTGRGDLWTFGMPAVLAGQGLLVLGLVLQLEGLWQSNRDTRETLDDLDRELAELRHTTAVLTTTHSAPGQSFYAHMAEGASPHLLLADVKGQLDVIAMRLAETRK
jgi:hypothetical protein